MSGPERPPSQDLSKPTVSELQASALVESVFGLKVTDIHPLPSYDDQNFHVRVPGATRDGGGPLECGPLECGPLEYVLKVNNTESSKNPDLVEVQSRVMMFLRAESFPVAAVHPTKGGSLTSLMAIDSGSGTKRYLVRLFTYLPGRPIAQVPVTPRLLYDVGKLAAQMDRCLEQFHHPKISSLQRGDFIWNLRNTPLLEKYIHALGQGKNREMVDQVLQHFKDEIVTKLGHFRECINHGDLNGYNILVEASSEASGDQAYRVSGILDFEDMSRGYYVFELAIAIMYMMIESKDSLAAGGHVLAGFESVIPLTDVERGALFVLVSSRFSQSLVMAAYTCQLYPENKDYLMITAKTGWKHLQNLLEVGQKAVEDIWFETAKSYTATI